MRGGNKDLDKAVEGKKTDLEQAKEHLRKLKSENAELRRSVDDSKKAEAMNREIQEENDARESAARSSMCVVA